MPLTPPKVFTATLSWKIRGFGTTVAELVGVIGDSLPPVVSDDVPTIVAVCSDARVITAPGYKVVTKPDDLKQRFCSSSVCIHVSYGACNRKVYKLKCFPTTTGSHQMPGLKRNDLSDGEEVLAAWLAFLTERGYKGSAGGGFTVVETSVSLMNAKFELGAGLLAAETNLDLKRLQTILDAEIVTDAAGGAGGPPRHAPPLLSETGALRPRPPFPITFVDRAVETQKFSVIFEHAAADAATKVRKNVNPKVLVNPNGKFTILGEKSFDAVLKIHAYFDKLLATEPSLLRKAIAPHKADDGEETDDETVAVRMRAERGRRAFSELIERGDWGRIGRGR